MQLDMVLCSGRLDKVILVREFSKWSRSAETNLTKFDRLTRVLYTSYRINWEAPRAAGNRGYT